MDLEAGLLCMEGELVEELGSFFIDDTQDWSPSSTLSGLGGNILNFLKKQLWFHN